MTLRSAARTIPSDAKIPMAVPACEMASNAYSTWYRRPSGEKMVVLESYLRDMVTDDQAEVDGKRR